MRIKPTRNFRAWDEKPEPLLELPSNIDLSSRQFLELEVRPPEAYVAQARPPQLARPEAPEKKSAEKPARKPRARAEPKEKAPKKRVLNVEATSEELDALKARVAALGTSENINERWYADFVTSEPKTRPKNSELVRLTTTLIDNLKKSFDKLAELEQRRKKNLDDLKARNAGVKERNTKRKGTNESLEVEEPELKFSRTDPNSIMTTVGLEIKAIGEQLNTLMTQIPGKLDMDFDKFEDARYSAKEIAAANTRKKNIQYHKVKDYVEITNALLDVMVKLADQVPTIINEFGQGVCNKNAKVQDPDCEGQNIQLQMVELMRSASDVVVGKKKAKRVLLLTLKRNLDIIEKTLGLQAENYRVFKEADVMRRIRNVVFTGPATDGMESDMVKLFYATIKANIQKLTGCGRHTPGSKEDIQDILEFAADEVEFNKQFSKRVCGVILKLKNKTLQDELKKSCEVCKGDNLAKLSEKNKKLQDKIKEQKTEKKQAQKAAKTAKAAAKAAQKEPANAAESKETSDKKSKKVSGENQAKAAQKEPAKSAEGKKTSNKKNQAKAAQKQPAKSAEGKKTSNKKNQTKAAQKESAEPTEAPQGKKKIPKQSKLLEQDQIEKRKAEEEERKAKEAQEARIRVQQINEQAKEDAREFLKFAIQKGENLSGLKSIPAALKKEFENTVNRTNIDWDLFETSTQGGVQTGVLSRIQRVQAVMKYYANLGAADTKPDSVRDLINKAFQAMMIRSQKAAASLNFQEIPLTATVLLENDLKAVLSQEVLDQLKPAKQPVKAPQVKRVQKQTEDKDIVEFIQNFALPVFSEVRKQTYRPKLLEPTKNVGLLEETENIKRANLPRLANGFKEIREFEERQAQRARNFLDREGLRPQAAGVEDEVPWADGLDVVWKNYAQRRKLISDDTTIASLAERLRRLYFMIEQEESTKPVLKTDEDYKKLVNRLPTLESQYSDAYDSIIGYELPPVKPADLTNAQNINDLESDLLYMLPKYRSRRNVIKPVQPDKFKTAIQKLYPNSMDSINVQYLYNFIRANPNINSIDDIGHAIQVFITANNLDLTDARTQKNVDILEVDLWRFFDRYFYFTRQVLDAAMVKLQTFVNTRGVEVCGHFVDQNPGSPPTVIKKYAIGLEREPAASGRDDEEEKTEGNLRRSTRARRPPAKLGDVPRGRGGAKRGRGAGNRGRGRKGSQFDEGTRQDAADKQTLVVSVGDDNVQNRDALLDEDEVEATQNENRDALPDENEVDATANNTEPNPPATEARQPVVAQNTDQRESSSSDDDSSDGSSDDTPSKVIKQPDVPDVPDIPSCEACEPASYTPYMFHTHPAACSPFPSVADFIRVKEHNIKMMLIATRWGVFRLQSMPKIPSRDKQPQINTQELGRALADLARTDDTSLSWEELLAKTRDENGITQIVDAKTIIDEYLEKVFPLKSGIWLNFYPWSIALKDFRISDVRYDEWLKVRPDLQKQPAPADQPSAEPSLAAGRDTQAEYEDLLLGFLSKLSSRVKPSKLLPVVQQIQQRPSFEPIARLFPTTDRRQAAKDLRTVDEMMRQNPTPDLLASLLTYVATPDFDAHVARLQ